MMHAAPVSASNPAGRRTIRMAPKKHSHQPGLAMPVIMREQRRKYRSQYMTARTQYPVIEIVHAAPAYCQVLNGTQDYPHGSEEA